MPKVKTCGAAKPKPLLRKSVQAVKASLMSKGKSKASQSEKAKSKALPSEKGGASVKENKAHPTPCQSKASRLPETVLESMLPPVKKPKAERPTEKAPPIAEKQPPIASGQPNGTNKSSAEPSAERPTEKVPPIAEKQPPIASDQPNGTNKSSAEPSAERPTEKEPPIASGQLSPRGTAGPLASGAAEPLPTASGEPVMLQPPAEVASNKSDAAGAASPLAKSASDAAAMPASAKGAPALAPESLVAPPAKPPPLSQATMDVMRGALAGSGPRPRSDEFKSQAAAKQRFNRMEKSGKIPKKVLLELATAEGKQEWWAKFVKDPECFIKAQMQTELSNVDETINEDGMGWMTEAQIEKMMNCAVVAGELKAEAMRRPKHMKKNKFLPDEQSEKAMLYLVPLTATEKARRRAAESNVQKFSAEADPDDAIELAKQIHGASSCLKERATGLKERATASGIEGSVGSDGSRDGPPPADEEAARKAAEAKRSRALERERVKNLPSSKALAWVLLCNNKLGDVGNFDARLEGAKGRLDIDVCSAYQRQLKELAAKTKRIREAVESANEGHQDEQIVKLLGEAGTVMDQLKSATTSVANFLKEPKAKAASKTAAAPTQ